MARATDRRKLLCAHPECFFLVHSQPKFNGFCCKKCFESLSKGGGPDHGVLCEGVPGGPWLERAESDPPQGCSKACKKAAVAENVHVEAEVDCELEAFETTVGNTRVYCIRASNAKHQHQWLQVASNYRDEALAALSDNVGRDDVSRLDLHSHADSEWQSELRDKLRGAFPGECFELISVQSRSWDNCYAVGIASNKKTRERASNLALAFAISNLSEDIQCSFQNIVGDMEVRTLPVKPTQPSTPPPKSKLELAQGLTPTAQVLPQAKPKPLPRPTTKVVGELFYPAPKPMGRPSTSVYLNLQQSGEEQDEESDFIHEDIEDEETTQETTQAMIQDYLMQETRHEASYSSSSPSRPSKRLGAVPRPTPSKRSKPLDLATLESGVATEDNVDNFASVPYEQMESAYATEASVGQTDSKCIDEQDSALRSLFHEHGFTNAEFLRIRQHIEEVSETQERMHTIEDFASAVVSAPDCIALATNSELGPDATGRLMKAWSAARTARAEAIAARRPRQPSLPPPSHLRPTPPPPPNTHNTRILAISDVLGMQPDVRPTFGKGEHAGKPLESLIDDLCNGIVDHMQCPTLIIRVYEVKYTERGRSTCVYYARDHRRLVCMQKAGVTHFRAKIEKSRGVDEVVSKFRNKGIRIQDISVRPQ